jgi:hypothetical protein
MLKKYGKFFARWTGADGKRHSKACKTKPAARKLQRQMQLERETKKAHATRPPSARSRRRGRKAATRTKKRQRKTSPQPSAISGPANSQT